MTIYSEKVSNMIPQFHRRRQNIPISEFVGAVYWQQCNDNRGEFKGGRETIYQKKIAPQTESKLIRMICVVA